MTDLMRLGDVCTKIGSGSTPRGGKEVYLQTGPYSLIRSQNIYNEGFSSTGLVFIDDEQAKRLEGVSVLEGDVLLNITGDSVARACQVPKDVLPARVNQHVAIIRPEPKILDPRFLRFYLVSPSVQAELLGLASAGATRNALTKSMIENLQIPRISIEKQQSIALFLGAIEDKIDINSRINATLEAIAKLIFKEWFIDFGPFFEKQTKNFTSKVSASISPLYSDSLSTRGVPSSWSHTILSDWGTLITGKTPPTAKLENFGKEIPFITPSDMDGQRIVLRPGRYLSEMGADSVRSSNIHKKSILVSCIGSDMGKVSIAPHRCVTNQQINAITPNSMENIDYLYYNLSLRKLELMQMAGGSALPILSKSGLAKLDILKPPDELIHEFNNVVVPGTKKIEVNLNENIFLEELKTLMLPRLIAGNIEVKSLQTLTEAVL